MDLNSLRKLAGIGQVCDASTDESAPPGMGDLVMRLKEAYPGHDGMAVATAWKIHNHVNEGVDNEIDTITMDIPLMIRMLEFAREDAASDAELHEVVSELISIMQQKDTLTMSDYELVTDDRGSADDEDDDTTVREARGSKEAIKAPFHAHEINELVPLSYEEALPKAIALVDRCSAKPEKKHYLTRQLENNRKGVQGLVEILWNMLLSFEGNAVIGSGYSRKFRESANSSPVGFKSIMRDIYREAKRFSAMVDIDTTIKILTGRHDLTPDEQEDVRDYLVELNKERKFDSTVANITSEGIDNGYNDSHIVDEFGEYPGYALPNGSDGPVVKKVGPSGAKQGDNPEQKKMAVSEVHRELVHKYRSYLKENVISDKMTKPVPLSISLEDYNSECSSDSDDHVYDGQITLVGIGVDTAGDPVHISYTVDVVATGIVDWEEDDVPTMSNSRDGIGHKMAHAPTLSKVTVDKLTNISDVTIDGVDADLGALSDETQEKMLDRSIYEPAVRRIMDRCIHDGERNLD